MTSLPRPKPTYILALDLGTRTGWALARGNVLVNSGSRYFPVPKDNAQGLGLRALGYYNWLSQHFSTVDMILFEDASAHQKSKASAEVWNGLLVITRMVAAGANIVMPPGIHTATAKKTFAGHGHATKEQVCAAAHARGWKHGTKGTADLDDEADALAVLHTYLETQRGSRLIIT